MSSSEPQNIIRIATYNIASTSFCPENGVEKLNNILRNKNIDISGIQELDICNGRHNYDMLEKFKEYGYFPHSAFRKSIDFLGGAYGIGILSRLVPQKISGGALPSMDFEGRAFIRMLTEKDGKQLAFYNTHLSYEDEDLKMHQMHFLTDIIMNDPVPYKILTGDFNTDKNRQELYPLLENFNITNGADNVFLETFNRESDDMPLRSIDNIVYTRNIRLLDFGMVESNISDHNMLWAELELLDDFEPSLQYLHLILEQAESVDRTKLSADKTKNLESLINAAKSLPASAPQSEIDSIRKAIQKII